MALLSVLLVHTEYLLLPGLAGSIGSGGFIAGDLFFVLSGFLITSMLLQQSQRDGRVDFRRFYARRARRILPALVFMVGCHLIYIAISGDETIRVELFSIFAVVGFFLNWMYASGQHLSFGLGQAWSLSVEEQFYLAWPLIIAAVMIRPRPARAFARVVVVGVLAAMTIRVALSATGTPWDHVYVRTDGRADSLLIGAGLAYALFRGWRPPGWTQAAGWAGAAVLLVVGAFAHREDSWLPYGGYTVVAVASALVVLAVLDPARPLAQLLSTRPMRWLGSVSYTVYLWHYPVFFATERHLAHAPDVVRLGVAYGITGMATFVSRRYVEARFLKSRALPTPAADAARPASVDRTQPAVESIQP